MKHYVLLLLLLLIFGNGVRSQTANQLLPASPNAANIGYFEAVKPDLFKGMSQISIPITSFKNGKNNYDVGLSYHLGAVKPGLMHSWSGLGWSLLAGGMITRKTNMAPDELLNSSVSPSNLMSYYDHPTVLAAANWYTNPTIMTTFGLAFPSYAPDEFIFNFGNYSGSFFLDQEGKWRVYSKSPVNIKVQEELVTDFVLPMQTVAFSNLYLPRIFYKFTLTTPDGYKYIFGGTTESIEFSRSIGGDDIDEKNVIATSWSLTQIVAPSGEQVDFTYEQSGLNIQVSQNIQILHETYMGSSVNMSDYMVSNATIINPTYLTSIQSSTEKIVFYKSVSSQLDFTYNGHIYDQLDQAAIRYRDISQGQRSDILQNIRRYKLDSISVLDYKDNRIRSIAFHYREGSLYRLRLDSLTFLGNKSDPAMGYSFKYSAGELPAYNSRMIDHWGFYNGTDYLAQNHSIGSDELQNQQIISAYTASRNTNPTYLLNGTLRSITQPTGAITEIELEPNTYAAYVKKAPYSLADTSITICGGLRLKKIQVKNIAGQILSSKRYHYVKGYKTQDSTCSGILSGLPAYLETGQLSTQAGSETGTVTYWKLSDHPVYQLSNTDGYHVTYSEVVEENADGSYQVNNYSNHDQLQYRDELALAVTMPAATNVTPAEFASMHNNTSMELERGKILEVSTYTAGDSLRKKEIFHYDEDPSRKTEAIRLVEVFQDLYTFGEYSVLDSRAVARLIYTFPSYLSQHEVITYNANGTNVSESVTNTYNKQYRQLQQVRTVNSRADTTLSYSLYPFDYLDDASVLQEMKTANIMNKPVEEVSLIKRGSWSVISAKLHKYKWHVKGELEEEFNLEDSLPMLLSNFKFSNRTQTGFPSMGVQGNFIVGTNYKKQQTYTSYDDRYNLLETIDQAGKYDSYLWDYSKNYLTCFAENSKSQNIAFTSFEAENKGNWTYDGVAVIDASSPAGRNCYNLNGHTINKAGLSSSVHYVLSYWVKGTTMPTISGGTTDTTLSGVVITEGVWKQYRRYFSGASSLSLSSSASVYVDDLCLYPAEASLTVYNYIPLVGMSRQTDPKSLTTYYEYDGFQRLQAIRDQNMNVVASYDYHYLKPVAVVEPVDSNAYSNFIQQLTLRKYDCGAGYHGTMVTYTVPAGTYHASTQQQANQLAENDVIANAQNYANAHGTCEADGVYAWICEGPRQQIQNGPYLEEWADVYIRLSLDSQGALTDLGSSTHTITYRVYNGSNNVGTNYTVTVYDGQIHLGYEMLSSIYTWDVPPGETVEPEEFIYELVPMTGYTVITAGAVPCNAEEQ